MKRVACLGPAAPALAAWAKVARGLKEWKNCRKCFLMLSSSAAQMIFVHFVQPVNQSQKLLLGGRLAGGGRKLLRGQQG